jgi:DNA-binding MarR family transcriptional regulator
MPKKLDKNKPIWAKVLLDKSLSPAGRLVFSYLYWRQGLNGSSWPSQIMIAEDLGLTRRGVIKITRRLEQKNYIRIIRPSIQGRGQHLKYCVLDKPKRVNETTPFKVKKGEQTTPLLGKKG